MPWLLWITHTFSCIDTLHPESWNNITIYYKIYFESIQGSGSCWRFSICSAAKWVVWCLLDFLAQPMFGWPQGDQKKQRKTLGGWLPLSLFVEETSRQVDSVWWYLCAKSVKCGGGGATKWFLGALPPVHCHGALSLSIYAWISILFYSKDATRLDK